MTQMRVLTVAVMVVGLVLHVKLATGTCSSSCVVQQDIISCRLVRPADVRDCVRRHPRATVLDLSYIDKQVTLTRRSLPAKLRHIVILYLDRTRVRRVDADALAAMAGLKMVFARRIRGPLSQLLEAVVASPAVRQVALADNFLVCSCSWLRAVERLSAADVAITDQLDAAPRCSDETLRRCRGTSNDDMTHFHPLTPTVAVWIQL